MVIGIWFNASPNAKHYCTLGGEDFVLEGHEVDIGSVFLCSVMWCGHLHEEADTQLLRATLSRDPGPPMFLSEAGQNHPDRDRSENIATQLAYIASAALHC